MVQVLSEMTDCLCFIMMLTERVNCPPRSFTLNFPVAPGTDLSTEILEKPGSVPRPGDRCSVIDRGSLWFLHFTVDWLAQF